MEKLGVKICCVLAVLLFTLLIPLAQATPPTTAEGTWTYTQAITSARYADGNLILTVTENRVWIGTFEGTSAPDVIRGVIHSNGKLTFDGLINFEGTVGTASGTLVIHVSGRGTLSEFYGQWVILSGAGGLANLRGQGAFSLEGPNVVQYTGQIHFELD